MTEHDLPEFTPEMKKLLMQHKRIPLEMLLKRVSGQVILCDHPVGALYTRIQIKHPRVPNLLVLGEAEGIYRGDWVRATVLARQEWPRSNGEIYVPRKLRRTEAVYGPLTVIASNGKFTL